MLFSKEIILLTHGFTGGLGGMIIISSPPSPTPPLTHLISLRVRISTPDNPDASSKKLHFTDAELSVLFMILRF
jgi:hypothetical protein